MQKSVFFFLLLQLLGSLTVISIVLLLQYGYHQTPCTLCYAERTGWYVLVCLSILALLGQIFTNVRKWLLLIIVLLGSLALLWNVLFALLHLNLLYHFIAVDERAFCTAEGFDTLTTVPCTNVTSFLGLSLPGWNLIVSLLNLLYLWGGFLYIAHAFRHNRSG